MVRGRQYDLWVTLAVLASTGFAVSASASPGCILRTVATLGPTPNELSILATETEGAAEPMPVEAPSPSATTVPAGDEAATIGSETLAAPRICATRKNIEFPVLANAHFLSSFGAVRDGGERWHAGVDIEAPKMTPVVAVSDGVVSTVGTQPGDCCWVSVRHSDGWTSMYVHLNNDHPGTDDGKVVGIRPGLKEGDAVQAGELLGWVGDSGNAESGISHLHFEIRTPSGVAIDPYPSLTAAYRRLPLALAYPDGLTDGEAMTVEIRDFEGAFVDDDAQPRAEAPFLQLLEAGASPWCDRWGIRVCPDRVATGTDLTVWTQKLADTETFAAILYPEPLRELTDLDQYCGRAVLCPTGPVTWAEVAAAYLSQTTGVPRQPVEAFVEIGHRFGVCPDAVVDPDTTPTRLELATTLLRLTTGGMPVPCASIT